MSIASEISRLQTAKSDIKTAIEAKGVTVPSSATIDTYDDYVSQISGGGGLSRTTSGTPYCTGHDLYVDVTTDISIDGGISWVESGVTTLLVESGSSQCTRLPAGYTEVEYIENTGNSYINTTLQLCSATTNTFQVEAKLIPNRIGTQQYQNIFSCMSEDGEPYQGFAYRYYNNSTTTASYFNPLNNGLITEVSNGDGTKSVTAATTNGLTYSHTYPLTICCGLDSSRSPFRYTNTRIYTFKVTLNNGIAADYVPAKRDSDSVYGLYDVITDTFYTSPNGNNFIGGNPV